MCHYVSSSDIGLAQRRKLAINNFGLCHIQKYSFHVIMFKRYVSPAFCGVYWPDVWAYSAHSSFL